MAINFSEVTAISIPEGDIISIIDNNGNILWQKSSRIDLLATCTNKGWRSTSNTISGDGTDPNW